MGQKGTLLLLFFVVSSVQIFGQNLPVGTSGLEDYYRREQLLGRLDSTISFSIRPLSQEVLHKHNIFDPTGEVGDKSILWDNADKGRVQVLPLTWQNQVTTGYPYGWNDGAMIPAVGYQTYFSAGIYASYKFLSIQLRPEVVYAQNSDYPGFNGSSRQEWQTYFSWLGNRIDMPEYFGNGSYTRFLPGQSSLRLNFHPISIGISTENLWWGPGRRNSLMMSNTAPGFPHVTLNTTRPIRTPIGSFEGQFATGFLKASGFDPTRLGIGSYDGFYRPKDGLSKRYFQGLIVSYQPKWLPGLTLGGTRAVIVNWRNIGSGLKAHLPLLFNSLSKSSSVDPETGQVIADTRSDDEYFSVFGRWIIPESGAEVYGEFGRTDASWDTRDLLVQLEHTRAYTVGFSKMVDLHKPQGDLLQVNLEVTQTEVPKTANLRASLPWYTHSLVRNGYTHLGQTLGAGIGSGSNVQSVDFSWIRAMKQIGLQVERLVHNNDLYYRLFGEGLGFKDPRRNWVDLSLAAHGVWDYKNFIFTGKVQFMKAFNYQYGLIENEDPALFWDFEQQDKNNVQLQFGASYRF